MKKHITILIFLIIAYIYFSLLIVACNGETAKKDKYIVTQVISTELTGSAIYTQWGNIEERRIVVVATNYLRQIKIITNVRHGYLFIGDKL